MTERNTGLVEMETPTGIFGFSRPFIEKIGVRVAYLGGVGIIIGGILCSFDAVAKESLNYFAIAAGSTFLGLRIVNVADMLKKTIWNKEINLRNAKG